MRKTVGYPSSMRYDGSVGDCPADICERFADLFESVHNVDNCDSGTEEMSGPSDGYGFSRYDGMTIFLLLLLNSAPMGSIQIKGCLPHPYFQDR
jgi:hypothetical protein